MGHARRKNEKVLPTLQAGGIAILTAIGLGAMSAKPSWLPILAGAIVAAIGYASAELAVFVAMVVLCVPIIASQPVLGFAVLVVLIASVRYLGSDGGRIFLIFGLSLIGAFVGPVWAGAALAGYLLGASEGALAAAIACVVIEACGIALGRDMIGAIVTGGRPAHAMLTFANMPETLLAREWVAHAFATLDAKSVTKMMDNLAQVSNPMMLFIQPWLWALGAVAAGKLGSRTRRDQSTMMSVAAVCAGVVVTAVCSASLGLGLEIPIPWESVGVSLFASLLVAVGFAVTWQQVFPPVKIPARQAPTRKATSMAREDADVDELLRLIATAEDKLATQHTSNRVVMITDMKSFSHMTEEDGSVATAKAIQRHRDLLLPIVQRYGGSGKSTGGDGLISAFESPADAILAATEMQRALSQYNAAHPGQREICVRVGLASGEVVLDNGGRPFIGAGLNLAARVMNLADGGQVFSTAEVAASAGTVDVKTHSFGKFELKNIAKPAEIVEILWSPDQQPRDPSETQAVVPPTEDE